MSGFLEFLSTHFIHVAPILAAGVIATAIVVERTRALFTLYPIADCDAFFDQVAQLVMSGKIADATALCDRLASKPAARVVKQALLRSHQPEALVENGLAIAVAVETQAVQKRTSFLATIANVATLLGLLGTIGGLISSFEAVGHADPQQKSALLAAGISTAMNATMLGLGVAIPCMVAFSFLMNRTNRLVAEVEQAGLRSLDILRQRFFQAEPGEGDAEDSAAPAQLVTRGGRAQPCQTLVQPGIPEGCEGLRPEQPGCPVGSRVQDVPEGNPHQRRVA